MAKPVFEQSDYKVYLNEIAHERGRGEKSRLAEALRCHVAYVSQVLNGAPHLSLEQADLLNLYLAHSDDEADFFLLLVSQARAGSASLRKRYEAKIRLALEARATLDQRLKSPKLLPAESQATYYRAWYFSAIHLLISIPEFQTKERLASQLGLPLPLVARALDFLVASGLAVFVKGRYQTGQVALHLKNDSPWIARHHESWRLQAIRAIERRDPIDLHYTSVVSMSVEEAPQVRKVMVEAIERIRAIVKESPEKGAFCYLMDFFPI